LRRRACVASTLRAATLGVVVRSTAVTVITLTETLAEVHRGNPLEMVEHIATSHSWSFERDCEDELVVVVRGKWCDYQLSFNWMHDIEALHLACAFKLEVPERNSAEVERLVPLINAQMWVGHFDLWHADELVMFRYSLVLSDGVEVSRRQCEVLLSAAIDACERYYTAFQFVAWAGEGAQEALAAAMFETAGEA
jgi:hypothetical protein